MTRGHLYTADDPLTCCLAARLTGVQTQDYDEAQEMDGYPGMDPDLDMPLSAQEYAMMMAGHEGGMDPAMMGGMGGMPGGAYPGEGYGGGDPYGRGGDPYGGGGDPYGGGGDPYGRGGGVDPSGDMRGQYQGHSMRGSHEAGY